MILDSDTLYRRRGFRDHMYHVIAIILTLLVLPFVLLAFPFSLRGSRSWPKPRRDSAEWIRDMELARRAQEYEESK